MIVDKIPEGFDRISIALAGEDTVRARIRLCDDQKVVLRDKTLGSPYQLGRVRGFGTESRGYIFEEIKEDGSNGPIMRLDYCNLRELFVETSEPSK